ncbi:hypothetical protein [Amycolatopsis arida]|nr:hypothetical protein [Amycolatopsis arida]
MGQGSGLAERVAWELHVELATRIAVVPLPEGEGLLVEAVASLDELGVRCRRVVQRLRPQPYPDSVGFRVESLARRLLVDLVDPFLRRWKPETTAWTERRPPGAGPLEHEAAWTEATVLRAELGRLREQLRPIAVELAELAGAAPLTVSAG